MAREVRNADIIMKTGVYLDDTCEKLNIIKTSFEANIKNMLGNYSGVDAATIANILTKSIDKIDKLVENLTYYSEYMIAISNHDYKNIDRATSKIQKKNKNNPILVKGEKIDELEQFKY